MGSVVGGFAGAAGGASLVSNVCQLLRSCVSASKHVGEQTDGVAGWRAQVGSGGICTLFTGPLGSGLGGAAHPDISSTSSSTSAVQIEMKGSAFFGVGGLRIVQFLFGFSAGGFFYGPLRFGFGQGLRVLLFGGLVGLLFGLQQERGNQGRTNQREKQHSDEGVKDFYRVHGCCAPMHLACAALRLSHKPQHIRLPGTEQS